MKTGIVRPFPPLPVLAGMAPLLLAGCVHFGKANAKAPGAPNPSSAVQVIPIAAPKGSTEGRPTQAPAFAPEYEEYYVGMIADTDDPTFAYRPGDLLVQTRPARFRFDGLGTADAPSFLPATTARMANDHPDPTAVEISGMALRSQRAISALTEQNESLLAQIAEFEKPAPKPGAAATAGSGSAAEKPSSAPAAPSKSDDDRLNIMTPNGDYVIELDPNFFVTPSPATTNPFVQLYQPPVTLHDVDLIVSAAVPGPNSSAIINDEPYSIGDRFKDLTVYRIDADTVYLRKDSFLLACPVSQRTLKLRLP
jgi:hypothetical protein